MCERVCVCSIMWFIFDWEPGHSFWGQPPNQSTTGRAYQDGYVGRFEIIVIGTHGGYIIYSPGCIMIDLQLDGLSCPEATYHLGRALIYQIQLQKPTGREESGGCNVTAKSL